MHRSSVRHSVAMRASRLLPNSSTNNLLRLLRVGFFQHLNSPRAARSFSKMARRSKLSCHRHRSRFPTYKTFRGYPKAMGMLQLKMVAPWVCIWARHLGLGWPDKCLLSTKISPPKVNLFQLIWPRRLNSRPLPKHYRVRLGSTFISNSIARGSTVRIKSAGQISNSWRILKWLTGSTTKPNVSIVSCTLTSYSKISKPLWRLSSWTSSRIAASYPLW